MTLQGDTTGELSRLFWAVRDGQCSSEDLANLENLLHDRPDLRQSYIRFTMMCGMLRYMRASSVSTDAPHELPILPIAPRQPHGLLVGALRTSGSLFTSGWPVAYLIATVLFTVGLTIAAIVHVSQPASIVLPSPSGGRHEAVGPSGEGSRDSSSIVARVTGMVDCKWEGSGFGVQGSGAANQKSEIINHKSDLRIGDRLALRSGLLELTYDTGARVILQGPVTYEVESPAGGYLSVGKLTAKLEQKSEVGSQRSEVRGQRSEPANQKSEITNHQFAVRTPTALVTDLGTEFGVEVSQEGRTEAQVFAGTIQITPPGGRSGSAKARVVHAGSAVRWDDANDQATVIEPSEQRFVRMLPAQEPTAYNSADDYAKLVLSLRPVAYYRMEPSTNPKDRTVIVDSASGGHHGTLASTHELADPWTSGRYGRSLRLNGLHYVVVRNVPGATARQLSVSAWVYARFVRDWCMIASEHYVDANNPQLWHDSDAWQFNLGIHDVGGDLYIGVNQSNRVAVSLREGAATPLPTGQWQHVAFVADGSSLRLYRNGIEVASTACDGVCVVPTIQCLTIGCKGTNRSWNDSEVSPNYFWRGNIDELAIFNHALSAGDIRQLCEGRPEMPLRKTKTSR